MNPFDSPRRVATNGIELTVYEDGPEAGRPIILCHGFPEIAYSWRHQMKPLADAGYRVIAPDQRGYNTSDQPASVEAYDITQLCADLAGLLDETGHDQAVFAGHDWGAIIVWGMALLHPERVAGVINLSVPFMIRGDEEWVGLWEKLLGPDFYIVHFNRQPGIADAAFARDPGNLLRNLYRTGQWNDAPREPPEGPEGPEGMAMMTLVEATQPPGELMMSEAELEVFTRAFETSGFTGPINYYRNFTRNWHILGEVEQKVSQPTLMIHGEHDMVKAQPEMATYVPNLEIHTLDCGHWIQQERPIETNALMLDWLSRHYPGSDPESDPA
ncbi:MAG: alpha/beta hydrolase [Gammaproteobacteria bacterium]|nr:MAG: alpha/beta hydrolase [Gammaproteobacteria bacterium]TDJ41346.1 MAG: alpha/beta hydrolase [Gammaproteobacteria bacterium]